MHRLISARCIIPYLVLVIVFYFLFEGLTSYFITAPPEMCHAVDAHAMKTGQFFDSDFVIKAKTAYYNHDRFFKSWFLLDLIFPVIYSLLFFSCAGLYRNSKPANIHLQQHYRYLCYIIIAGALLDYGENFSFAFFLRSTSDALAPVVASFTAFKSVFFTINIGLALACTITALLRKKRRYA